MSNKQYDRAIEDYNVAIELDPNCALSYMDRGAAYYFKGEYQNAINNYDQAVKLDPKRAQAYSNRAAAYKKLGRHEEAVADNNTAITIDPINPLFYDNRGLDYEADGDFDRAIADFNEAIRLKPQANFLTNRGDCYNQKHDYDRAIADYNRALELDPTFGLALNNRGVTYAQKGDFDRAIANFEQALRVDPHLDSAASGLADAREQRARRQLTDTKVKPTFDCDAREAGGREGNLLRPRAGQLDRDIDDAYRAALDRLTPPRRGSCGASNAISSLVATRNSAAPTISSKRAGEPAGGAAARPGGIEAVLAWPGTQSRKCRFGVEVIELTAERVRSRSDPARRQAPAAT